MLASTVIVFLLLLWALQFSLSQSTVPGKERRLQRAPCVLGEMCKMDWKGNLSPWLPSPLLSAHRLWLTGESLKATVQGFGWVNPWDLEKKILEKIMKGRMCSRNSSKARPCRAVPHVQCVLNQCCWQKGSWPTLKRAAPSVQGRHLCSTLKVLMYFLF